MRAGWLLTLDVGRWTLDFNVPGIRPNRQQEEERAEDVLALGSPSHRFDVQRMQGKQCRHQGTSPQRAGHAPQQQEEHKGISDVKAHTHQVGSSGLEAEELTVQHMGKPGQRMPVAGVAGLKGPNNILPLQPALNMRILRDIIRVVIIDKGLPCDRHEDSQRGHGERQADKTRAAQLLHPGGAPGLGISLLSQWYLRSLRHCRTLRGKELNQSLPVRNEKPYGCGRRLPVPPCLWPRRQGAVLSAPSEIANTRTCRASSDARGALRTARLTTWSLG